MNLEKYLYKSVNVTDIYGKTYSNYFVDLFSSAEEDGEANEDSIGLLTNEASKFGTLLYASEIKKIEEVNKR